MINIVIAYIIFLIALVTYLLLQKKNIWEDRQKIKKLIFAIIFAFIGVYSAYRGFIIVDNKAYAIIFIVCFMSGLFFDISSNIVGLIIVVVGLWMREDVYDNNLTMKVDIISCICVTAIGYLLQKRIYKKTWPSIFSSVIYTILLLTNYMIINLLVLAFKDNIDIFKLASKTIVVKTIIYFVSLLIIFIILNVFFKKDDVEKNTILHKFLRRFNVLVLVLYILAFIFTYVFYSIFLHKVYNEILNVNYDIAMTASDIYIEKYGENYLDNNKMTEVNFSNWVLNVRGAVYILDKDFRRKNNFKLLDDDIVEYVRDEHFSNLYKYKEGEIVEYQGINEEFLVKYGRTGNYYILVFIPKVEVTEATYTASCIASYAEVIIFISMFILVYMLIKYSISDRMKGVNIKLKRIIDGDYDVKMDDSSSIEFVELSDSINKTVGALKDTINKIEEKSEEELRLAKRIQQNQLPAINADTVGYNIYAKNIPAEDVGGDFYDCFHVGSKYILFLIADVSGKGIPAAMFMMKVKHTIMNAAKMYYTLEDIVKRTNAILCENNDSMMFVTCFIGLLNIETGVLEYVNAGHNTPIFGNVIENGIEYNFIDTKSDLMFGVDENGNWNVHKIKMKPNDMFFLYTDGVTEARNKHKEFYGMDRLQNIFDTRQYLDVKYCCEDVLKNVEMFVDGAEQHDDITVLAFKYIGMKNEIVLDATFNDIERGKTFLSSYLDLCGAGVSIVRDVKVVYDEIYSNIMKHAYKYNGGELIFKLNVVNGNELEMVFMDKGPEFDPVHYNENIDRTADEKINGGMGIMFCKNIMDRCEYERKDEYNILMMYKAM